MDSQAKLVFDNRLALDHSWAEQEGACTCCIWIDISGEAETQVCKISE